MRIKFKYYIYIFVFMLFFGISFAQQAYNVKTPKQYIENNQNMPDEKVLFILDFSSSMTEKIEGKSKAFLMLCTLRSILPKISPKTYVGLRVYGHRLGITQYDACKASSLLVPIKQDSKNEINLALTKTRPRGMTPITYSLKKAVNSDFYGFAGKKHIILLTDGGENCDESPCVWAMDLVSKRNDVVIDVIAFNIDDKEDLDQLKCTALVTTGKFHSAKTTAELIRGFEKSLNIKKDVDAKIILNEN